MRQNPLTSLTYTEWICITVYYINNKRKYCKTTLRNVRELHARGKHRVQKKVEQIRLRCRRMFWLIVRGPTSFPQLPLQEGTNETMIYVQIQTSNLSTASSRTLHCCTRRDFTTTSTCKSCTS